MKQIRKQVKKIEKKKKKKKKDNIYVKRGKKAVFYVVPLVREKKFNVWLCCAKKGVINSHEE